MRVIDLFAGPGGWDEGLRSFGLAPLGIEIDEQACLTREAAGHPTIRQDVAALDPHELAPCDLLLASPPCQAFSVAGKGAGRGNADAILDLAAPVARGEDRRAEFAGRIADPRALLVVEPLRYTLALRPTWVAFEQVPTVLPLWERFATHLREAGYATWTGKVSSEEFGVPQVRKRALLLASLRSVDAPLSTHQAYGGVVTPDRAPWVSMAQALGWGATHRPYYTLAGGTKGGPCYDFVGGSGSRRGLLAERAGGRWITGPRENLAEAIVRLTFEEAGVLQGFPANYPWQGTRTSKAVQIGNAVPPPLARAIVSGLVGASLLGHEAA